MSKTLYDFLQSNYAIYGYKCLESAPMTIRLAKTNDLEDLQKLNQQIFNYEIEHCQPPGWNANYPYEKAGIEYLKKAINNIDGFNAFVFEKEGKSIGYMILYSVPESDLSHRNGIQLVQLHTFCVADGHRNSGIGKKMVSFAKDWAKKQGATHLKVVASAKNKNARAVYESCGFDEFEISYEIAI